MKKRTILPILVILLLSVTVAVLGFSLYQVNKESDSYQKAAELLISSYGFSIDPVGEIWKHEAEIDQARPFRDHYNLEGAVLDLTQVFPNDVAINSEYEDSVMRVYEFPLSTSQGVELEATILFLDDQLGVAQLTMANELAPSYIFDSGLAESPPYSWSLDVSKDVLNADLDTWAKVFRL